MANSVVINYLVKVSGTKDVETLKAKLTNLTTSKGFQSAVTGVGISAGMAAWSGLAMAVQQVPEALMGAARAAAEDEASQTKLYQAVAANTKGWDGNRSAIEKVLAERMKLAFSDEEQRDSLALLVAYTKNVTEALDIQRGAMDLARLKGIGLAEASKAIVMGMEGSGRALKELGIDVKDVTTKTEVLTKVQKASAGQAEAYAESSQGTFATLQITMDEIGESIGYIVLPALKDLAKTLRDDILPNVDQLSTAWDIFNMLLDPLGHQMGIVREEMERQQEATKEQRAALDALNPAMASYALRLDEIATTTAKLLPPMWTVGSAARAAGQGFDGWADGMRDASAAWSQLNDNIQNENEYANLPSKITLAKIEAQRAHKELSAALKSQNREAIAAATIRVNNAEAELRTLRLEWARLRAEMSKPVKVGEISRSGQPVERRASGGSVSVGRTYLVGEGGPELFSPSSSGTIYPNTAAMGGGSMTISIPVVLDGAEIARVVDRRNYFAASVAPASSR